MATTVYQLKISIRGIRPPIWRRLIVYADTTLIDLHKIIQTAMGWTNSHLHLFDDGRNEYASESFQLDYTISANNVKLNEILKKEKDKVYYLYDMGDSWEHEILPEKILDANEYDQIPLCIKGRRNCPPEDCGGIGGYKELLEILKDPNHEGYDGMLEWLGGEYDPEYVDEAEINKVLKQADYGCIMLF